jgi:hypothetical protein
MMRAGRFVYKLSMLLSPFFLAAIILNANTRRDQPTTHLKLPTTQLFSSGL